MRGRSVIEWMVLAFTFTVCFAIIGLGILIVVVESRNPEADTGVIANTLSTLVSGILGALLGVLAGRAGTGGGGGPTGDLDRRPDGSDDNLRGPP